jgi:hypothetical protein
MIYLLEVRDLVAARTIVEPTPAGGVAGYFDTVPVAPVELMGLAPKAVTRHTHFLGPEGDRWRCAVTVDV